MSTGHTVSVAAECMSNDMAFPVLDREQTPNNSWQLGLTKREYFAAMALSGLARAYANGGDFMEKHVAKGAVRIADALIEALTDDPKTLQK